MKNININNVKFLKKENKLISHLNSSFGNILTKPFKSHILLNLHIYTLVLELISLFLKLCEYTDIINNKKLLLIKNKFETYYKKISIKNVQLRGLRVNLNSNFKQIAPRVSNNKKINLLFLLASLIEHYTSGIMFQSIKKEVNIYLLEFINNNDKEIKDTAKRRNKFKKEILKHRKPVPTITRGITGGKFFELTKEPEKLNDLENLKIVASFSKSSFIKDKKNVKRLHAFKLLDESTYNYPLFTNIKEDFKKNNFRKVKSAIATIDFIPKEFFNTIISLFYYKNKNTSDLSASSKSKEGQVLPSQEFKFNIIKSLNNNHIKFIFIVKKRELQEPKIGFRLYRVPVKDKHNVTYEIYIITLLLEDLGIFYQTIENHKEVDYKSFMVSYNCNLSKIGRLARLLKEGGEDSPITVKFDNKTNKYHTNINYINFNSFLFNLIDLNKSIFIFNSIK